MKIFFSGDQRFRSLVFEKKIFYDTKPYKAANKSKDKYVKQLVNFSIIDSLSNHHETIDYQKLFQVFYGGWIHKFGILVLGKAIFSAIDTLLIV